MRKLFVIKERDCTGCQMCELVCSFKHYQEFNPTRSRIRVLKIDNYGIDMPVVCRLCKKPPCVEACTEDAIKKDEDLGVPILNYDKCIGCGLCKDACPVGAISIDAKTGDFILCDLCGGDPQCAKFCPTNAIMFHSADKADIYAKREAVVKYAISAKLMPKIEVKGKPHLFKDFYPEELKKMILKKERGE